MSHPTTTSSGIVVPRFPAQFSPEDLRFRLYTPSDGLSLIEFVDASVMRPDSDSVINDPNLCRRLTEDHHSVRRQEPDTAFLGCHLVHYQPPDSHPNDQQLVACYSIARESRPSYKIEELSIDAYATDILFRTKTDHIRSNLGVLVLDDLEERASRWSYDGRRDCRLGIYVLAHPFSMILGARYFKKFGSVIARSGVLETALYTKVYGATRKS